MPDERGLRAWVKKLKGLRSTSYLLLNSHGDVKYSIGNIVNNTLWWSLSKLYNISSLGYTPENNIMYVKYNWKIKIVLKWGGGEKAMKSFIKSVKVKATLSVCMFFTLLLFMANALGWLTQSLFISPFSLAAFQH